MSEETQNKKWWKRKPLAKTDAWLRKNMPTIWRTRIHYVLPVAILVYPVLFLLGLWYSSTCNNNDNLLVDPVMPIRLWREAYFQVSFLAAFIFYFYWFSIQSRKSSISFNIKRILISFLTYFIGVAFIFMLCTNAFRIGTIYEHAEYKMTDADTSIVKQNNYFLFGNANLKDYYNEVLFDSLFQKEQKLLDSRYDSIIMYRSNPSYRSYRSNLSDRSYRSYRSNLSYRSDLSYLSYRSVRSYLSYLSDLSYRSDRSDRPYLSYRSDLSDLLEEYLVNYELQLKKFTSDTVIQDSNSFIMKWKILLDEFQADSVLLDSVIQNNTSNPIKQYSKEVLLDISKKLDIYNYHIQYIFYYNRNTLSDFPKDDFLKRNHLTQKEGEFQIITSTTTLGTKYKKLYYSSPPKVLQLENRMRSVDHAHLFFKEKIHHRFYWSLLPYVILMSLGLVLAPFFNEEGRVKALFVLVPILLMMYLFLEKIPEDTFITEGSPYTWLYVLLLGIGNCILFTALLLKKNNSYIKSCFHIMIMLGLTAVIFSLYHFDFTLIEGIQDFTDLRETADKTEEEKSSLLMFVPSKIEYWGVVGMATITAFLAPLVFSQPRRN